jgi:hypothetical protein
VNFRGPGVSLLLLGLLVAVGMASALQRASEARTPQAIATQMSEELRAFRAEVDACLATQDQAESRFEALTQRAGDLREEVDYLESLDPRGVPAVHYDRYLELVEVFNATIPEWEQQTQDLRTQELRCRSLIGMHNERAEELRAYLVESGIWEDSWLQPEFIEEEEVGEEEDTETLEVLDGVENEDPAQSPSGGEDESPVGS